jgi:hypothetical protein
LVTPGDGRESPAAQSRRLRAQPLRRTWPGEMPGSGLIGQPGPSQKVDCVDTGTWPVLSIRRGYEAHHSLLLFLVARHVFLRTFEKGWFSSSLSQKPAAPVLVDAAISAVPVVMPRRLRQRRHASAIMVSHAVGNARGITSIMVIAYRPPRGPADPAAPLDTASHELAPGLQVATQVIGAGETGMQPGEGFNFLSR